MYKVRFDSETQINIDGKLIEVFVDGIMTDYGNSDELTPEDSVTAIIKKMAIKGYIFERLIKEEKVQ